MSHEENKNDSQFYYPAINTIFYVNVYFRSPCIHSANIYRVLLCARHWGVLDAEDVTGIPQTGDSNNMMGFGSVALVALAGMFGLRKKKGN